MDPITPKDNQIPQSPGAPTSPPPPVGNEKTRQPVVTEEMESVVKLESEPDTNPAATKTETEPTTLAPEASVLETPVQETVEPAPVEYRPPTETSEAAPSTDVPAAPTPSSDSDDDAYDPRLAGAQFFRREEKKLLAFLDKRKLIVIAAAATLLVLVAVLYFVLSGSGGSQASESSSTTSSDTPTTQPAIDETATATAIDEAVNSFIDQATSEQQITNTDDTDDLEAASSDVNAVGESIDEDNL